MPLFDEGLSYFQDTSVIKSLKPAQNVSFAAEQLKIESLLLKKSRDVGFEYICEKNEFLYFRKRK